MITLKFILVTYKRILFLKKVKIKDNLKDSIILNKRKVRKFADKSAKLSLIQIQMLFFPQELVISFPETLAVLLRRHGSSCKVGGDANSLHF